MLQTGEDVSAEPEVTMMRCMKSSEAAQTAYQDVAHQLEVDCYVGLSEYEVSQRRRNHGFNEFDIADDEPLWKKYLGQVVDYVFC